MGLRQEMKVESAWVVVVGGSGLRAAERRFVWCALCEGSAASRASLILPRPTESFLCKFRRVGIDEQSLLSALSFALWWRCCRYVPLSSPSAVGVSRTQRLCILHSMRLPDISTVQKQKRV